MRPPSTAPRPERASHEVYVQIANLQMARSRQKRIRRDLKGQVDRCTREIESINARIQSLYDRAGLEYVEPDDRPAPAEQSDDGFEYQY